MSNNSLWDKLEQLPAGHLNWTKADQIHAAISTLDMLIEDGTLGKGTKEYIVALRAIAILKTIIIKDGMKVDYSFNAQLHKTGTSHSCLYKIH